MDYKFAQSDTIVTVDNERIHLIAGEAWDPDCRVVQARPDLFDSRPPKVRNGTSHRTVEQATAAPGEKRATRR